MNAKPHDKEIQDLIDEADCNAEANFTKSDGSRGVLGWARKLIEVTATISFKAGQEAGRREVVEWLERARKIKVPKYQLKEWGIG